MSHLFEVTDYLRFMKEYGLYDGAMNNMLLTYANDQGGFESSTVQNGYMFDDVVTYKNSVSTSEPTSEVMISLEDYIDIIESPTWPPE